MTGTARVDAILDLIDAALVVRSIARTPDPFAGVTSHAEDQTPCAWDSPPACTNPY